MRTLFETSWVRDSWSPNFGLGQAGVSNPFADIATAAATGTKAYFDAEQAKAAADAKEAAAKAQIATAQAQAAAAYASGQNNLILGMSPSTAAIVGLLGVGAIIAVVMATKKK